MIPRKRLSKHVLTKNRKHPRLPKLCLHKGTGQGYVRLDGQMKYLGRYGDAETHKRYAVLIEQWQANGGTLPPPVDEITVTEIVTRYFEYCKERYIDPRTGKPTSTVATIRVTLKALRKLYGHEPAVKFDSPKLFAFQNTLKRVGLARRTINERVAIVRAMFRWAGKRGLAPSGHAAQLADVDGLSGRDHDVKQPKKIPPVSREAVDHTVPHLSPTVAAMVELQWLTGMRPGEVCGIRPCDIDRTDRVWVYCPVFHKTAHRGRKRVIFIGPKAQAVLADFLDRDADRCCFTPRESSAWHRWRRTVERKTPQSCGNRVGTNRKHKPLSTPGDRWETVAYARAIRRACDRAGIEPWRPNQLRHAAATWMRREHGLEVASLLLGHSSVEITDAVYAERDHKQLSSVVAQVG